MRYEGPVYRPPSEASSLIIQLTIGCSHNACTFCSMFKDKSFRIRNIEEVIADLKSARASYGCIKKIFLADADALVIKTENLVKILIKIKELFPECTTVSAYTTANDILRKSLSDFQKFHNLGLNILYLGIESGDDEVLAFTKKGTTASELVKAGKLVKESGIKISVTIISGLGGIKRSKSHAMLSGKVISEIDPDYLGLLTLTIDPGTEMEISVQRGELIPLSPKEVMIENRILIENLHLTNCILRSNHVCNYVALAATLGAEKDRLLRQLDMIIQGDLSI